MTVSPGAWSQGQRLTTTMTPELILQDVQDPDGRKVGVGAAGRGAA